MKEVHCDFEAYSEVDLPKEGMYKYAMHPSTEALMLSWQIDQGMVHLWDIHGGEPIPQRLQICIDNPDVIFKAFNAVTERLIFKYVLGIDIPTHRWRCTMCAAYRLGFSGGLDSILEQFVPGFQKDPRGKALIQRFSKPQPKSYKVSRWTSENDPEGYAEFKEYCIKDVEVENELDKKLSEYPYLESEHTLYFLDQKINDAGVPVDADLIKAALEVNDTERDLLLRRMKELTGLDNPNSGPQLLGWLEAQGSPMENLQKETIAEFLGSLYKEIEYGADRSMFEPVIEVLELKQQIAKASVTKWKAFGRCICPDGRVHGMFQFAGASRTNRWAGRLVQLQNLAKGKNTTKAPVTLAEIMLLGGHQMVKALYSDPMMALSDAIRCAITAPEGKLLNVADEKSIESVVLGWVSDCRRINQIFADGKDTYTDFATVVFNLEYSQVTRAQRNLCKPVVLGGGYMLSAGEVKENGDVTGLMAYAKSMGIEMDQDFAKECVRLFRYELYPEVPVFWQWCLDAVFHTTNTGVSVEGPHGLRTEMVGEFLFIWLPSGRPIAYHKPMILPKQMPWGEIKDAFTYMGINQHKNSKPWERISAHGGLITENIVQAIARDTLKEWMLRIDAAGYEIIGHIHDEVIVLHDSDVLEKLNELVRIPIPWAPGLNIDAAGFTTRRYYKD